MMRRVSRQAILQDLRRRARLLVVRLAMLLCVAWSSMAVAQQLPFRLLAQSDGLTNLGLSCLHQDRSGYILACTEHGLFIYDGQRFINLGPQQGLPEGGVVEDLTVTRAGNIVLRYASQIFISDESLSLSRSPAGLLFRPAISRIGPLFNLKDGQLASWADGAVLIEEGRLAFLDPGNGREAPVIRSAAGLFDQPRNAGGNALSVSGEGSTLWIGLEDGRLCQVARSPKRCFGPRDGLPSAHWTAILPDGHGLLLARSSSLLAVLDLSRGTITSEQLPRQDEGDGTAPQNVLLALTPRGEPLTQSASGLIVRERSGWRTINDTNGLPRLPLVGILFDHDGNLWVAGRGKGVLRTSGYRIWENWDHQDGLSSNDVWQLARAPHGPLWVATDNGVDALDGDAGHVIKRHLGTRSFGVAIDASGDLWRSLDTRGVARIDSRTGGERRFELPPVNQILRNGHRLWFITEGGLFVADGDAPGQAPVRAGHSTAALTGGVGAPDGSLWLLSRGNLIHRHPDGSEMVVMRDWGSPGFVALSIALGQDGSLWVGGPGAGLYHVMLSGDRISGTILVGPPDTLSSTVYSVLVDRRGWVWAGTDNGLSVFDGSRWLGVRTSGGLIWNDLNQDSLFEDDDGSIWIGSSQGVSHLLDPAALFRPQVFHPVISSVTVGNRLFVDRAVPFSRDPLVLHFGALDVRTEVRFRYRLDGVDRSWADTQRGEARYPALPFGHHRFRVVAYDPLTRQTSEPLSIILRMRPPWFFYWPMQALYGLLVFALITGIWHLRYRYLLAQRLKLQQEVEHRTQELQAAQAALLVQATQDSLTALLTRGEIQRRLVAALASDVTLTVGLVDIDHFKRINDGFGHLVGDDILSEMGRRLAASLRAGEEAGRYGGEEILIVIRDARPSGAERMREFARAMCAEEFVVEDDFLAVTCSVGVAHARRHDTWKSLIGRADRALYCAKTEGRDRIVEEEAVMALELMTPLR